MALRKIITIENPILRQKAKRVTRFDASIKRLVDDMIETMHAANGVGLAAPQVAQSLRILVAEYEDRLEVLINPEIVKASGEQIGTEGCLSIPGYIGENIKRSMMVIVKGRDVHGKEVRVRADGFFARILQHEIDHLDGILYLDHLQRPEDLRRVEEDEEVSEVTPESPSKATTPAKVASATSHTDESHSS
ncbi:MAG TPA: peptide deformylase [Ktedonobacterales bacterium]|nr:peptide deformylase [Ktedonobacterales bacterium]